MMEITTIMQLYIHYHTHTHTHTCTQSPHSASYILALHAQCCDTRSWTIEQPWHEWSICNLTNQQSYYIVIIHAEYNVRKTVDSAWNCGKHCTQVSIHQLSKLFGVHCGHVIKLAQCQENGWKYIKFWETVHTSLFTKSSKLLGALSILSQEIILCIATIMKGINRLSCI